MSGLNRCCRECGASYTAQRAASEFCATPCRTAYHNRRRDRGSELYDLFMTMRYQRGLAKALGVWSIMCRLAQDWKQEDDETRNGRTSWGDPAAVIEKRPYLKGARFYVRAGR